MSGSQISHLNANGLVFSNNFSKVIQEILLATASVYLVPEVATPEIEKEYPSFVTGMMILHGERDLVLTLSFSRMAAADLMVSLLGSKYNQIIADDVYDAVKETTNMVAGKLKTATSSLGVSYQLTTPFIFVGTNHFWAAHSRPAGVVKKFKDKNFEMLAGIFFL
ncbi:MAG: chemotaxis protein CheX [Vallitaleaceae bacterium]|nr:chemotaxis protein CheX [Vallitaleaceae bacterium]